MRRLCGGKGAPGAIDGVRVSVWRWVVEGKGDCVSIYRQSTP